MIALSSQASVTFPNSAGNNVLWETRGLGGNTETAERLELDHTTGVEYGIVGYTHAGGVDRPLAAYKRAGGNSGDVVMPHMNWRGLFAFGTNEAGGTSTVEVEWPGFRTTAYHSMGETQGQTRNWMGSLLEGQRDAGGQMYMRNRYYDAKTGQFTQSDPIGIAGGLNTYGFAAGDPVSYDDPFGLCPWCLGIIVGGMRAAPYVIAAGNFVAQALDPNPDAGTAIVSGGRVILRAAGQPAGGHSVRRPSEV